LWYIKMYYIKESLNFKEVLHMIYWPKKGSTR
jgi:hypothetical protein